MPWNIPEISVIVPVYNVEQYLAECISSILSQTFTDFELLLVDDGSPDRCGEICDEYAGKDKRVRVFHQENAGLSCARNKGLEHASGTYIAFVDSDDYVTSTYLQELYASLPADKSQRGTVICGFDKLFPDGSLHTVHVPQQTILPMDCSRVLAELVGKYVMYAWAKLYDNRLITVSGLFLLCRDWKICSLCSTIFLIRIICLSAILPPIYIGWDILWLHYPLA